VVPFVEYARVFPPWPPATHILFPYAAPNDQLVNIPAPNPIHVVPFVEYAREFTDLPPETHMLFPYASENPFVENTFEPVAIQFVGGLLVEYAITFPVLPVTTHILFPYAAEYPAPNTDEPNPVQVIPSVEYARVFAP
jgi:hypothetical protein